MFDIGWSELVLVGVVALIVIGPKELPGMLRTVGGAIAKIRRMAGEFQSQFQEAMREAELDEARKTVEGLNQSASFNPIQTIRDEIQKAVDTPVKPADPTPAGDVKLDIPDPPPLPDLTPEQMQAAFEPPPAAPAPVAQAGEASVPAAEAHSPGVSTPPPTSTAAVEATSSTPQPPAAPVADAGPRIISPGEPPPMTRMPRRPPPDPESATG